MLKTGPFMGVLTQCLIYISDTSPDGVWKIVPAVLQQLSVHWVDNSCNDVNNKGERTITESALERKLLMRKNCISQKSI